MVSEPVGREPCDFLGTDRSGQGGARDFQGIRNTIGQARKNVPNIDRSLPGEQSLLPSSANRGLECQRELPLGVADMCEAEPFARQPSEPP